MEFWLRRPSVFRFNSAGAAETGMVKPIASKIAHFFLLKSINALRNLQTER